MKNVRKFAAICLGAAFLLSAPSCTVVMKKDNGKHKGWYKNTNNPHNSASSKTTGSGTKTTIKTNGSGTKVKMKSK